MSQEIVVPHEECGHGGIARIGQTMAGGRLRWYRSITCPGCGHIEEDGLGLPSEEFRTSLLQEGGKWNVVAEGGANGVAVSKVVKSALSLSLGEASAIVRDFPIAYQGTQTEAEWLQAQLASAGIASSIEQSAER